MECVSKMAQLEHLALDRAAISDKGIGHLRGLNKLKSLTLGVNGWTSGSITGACVESLTGMDQLRVLEIWHMENAGAALDHLPKLTALDTLLLPRNDLKSTELPELGKLGNMLKSLNISFCRANEPDIIKCLSQLPNLTALDISYDSTHSSMPIC